MPGCHPVSGRRHDLDEVVPAGPGAASKAEKVRARLLHEVDEQRNPKTRATVNQLLDRYLETLDVGPRTGRDVLQAAIKLLRSSMTAQSLPCRGSSRHHPFLSQQISSP